MSAPTGSSSVPQPSTAQPSAAFPSAPELPHIALIGNPNTGKSSVFNGLTGLRQKVGNYPGVTVERKLGTMHLGSRPCVLIDLPGTYSLSACSPDERVVVDALCGHIRNLPAPDLVVCVVEAANLKRNLFLPMQVAQTGVPMVIALNLWDEAQAKGIRIDVEKLSQRLGVAVVPTVARSGAGFAQLRQAMEAALNAAPGSQRLAPPRWPQIVDYATDAILAAAKGHTDVALSRMEAMRILFDANSAVLERVNTPAAQAAVRHAVEAGRAALRAVGCNPMAAEALLVYAHLDTLLDGVVQTGVGAKRQFSDAIDRLLVHRFWGLLLFLGLMYVVFQAVYTWAGPLIDAVGSAQEWLQGVALEYIPESMPVLQSLVGSGLIEGVGAFVVFLPQILILFFFIALLEDTGYMARAAFLMDKLFGWCGLNGKSFVPMLSSYACAIPGIMATRTIEDPKARTITALLAPFMSCSARLPVYVLIIGAFVEPVYGAWVAGLVLFAMHFVGLAVAIPLAWLLSRWVLRTRAQPFVLEMPPYRFPRARDVLYRIWMAGKEFVVRAGTVILAMTVIIWALLYFPHPEALPEKVQAEFVAHKAALAAAENAATVSDSTAAFGFASASTPAVAAPSNSASAAESVSASTAALETLLESGEGEQADALRAELEAAIDSAYIEQSFMGRAGKFMQPLFAPAGYDWKITVALLSSFPAREVVVTTLGVIYSLGGDVDEESGGLREALARATWADGPHKGQPVFTLPTALSLMVFFALCMQCGSTVIVLARQLSWRWAAFSFVSMTCLAWVCAVLVYQIGSLF